MAKVWSTKYIMTVFLYLCLWVSCIYSTIVFHEKLIGKVGAGNYSYYTLSREGSITIILNTLQGDSDLYISDHTKQPTFEIENHNLQSVTCGLDRIDVPFEFKRPIIIGVYGHPSQDFSIYELEVIVDDSPEEYKDYSTENLSSGSSPPPPVPSPSKRSHESDENSTLWSVFTTVLQILWTVFITVLQIVLEAFTS
ncbi:UPF0669 protein v1g209471-like [Centruroides sculpturatus]|uniref:UPF0669 protein v1g209471-like n=1 Tax=Centruroides sculpturatus TaxID=218467 RepID=UPI000C6CC682|nr:UPF0669 protein v1g209471-like [Centruroides sculpturatus]XP_023229501.1 UPF0669 protein v1g209471-like [Centruroides sculpturatus]XP_023229502.1 UPF0669 protein v1g209471-like [Centruroides sculpturatus]XP_023229505.1 UPF0669 protein v1g209471-like [Centruroides sculpturatus]XP_023229507.1 UPF0669 protein v1g209471-like [Centruroides sculpturatus]